MFLAVSLWLPPAAMAITNAELARLNNELIGLDAQLAVAKKKSELEKYRTNGGSVKPGSAAGAQLAPPRPDEAVNPEPSAVRKSKRDTAGEVPAATQPEGAKVVTRKLRPQ